MSSPLARVGNGLLERPFGFGSGRHGPAQGQEGLRVALTGWLVVLEAPRQAVALVEDVLHCAGHDRHLRDLSRAGLCDDVGVGYDGPRLHWERCLVRRLPHMMIV